MSESDSSHAAPKRQSLSKILQLVSIAVDLAIETLALVRNINRLLADPDCRRLAGKLLRVGNATIVPGGMSGGYEAIAALLDVEVLAAKEMVKRHKLTKCKPGAEVLVSLDDLRNAVAPD